MGKYGPGESEHNRRIYSMQSPRISNHIRDGSGVDTPSTHSSSATPAGKRKTCSGFRRIVNRKSMSRRWRTTVRASRHEPRIPSRRNSVNSSYEKAQTRSSAKQYFENRQSKLNNINYNVYNSTMMGQSMINERRMHRNKTTLFSKERGSFQDYCDQCTMHGLRYIGNNSLPKLERIFWLISVVIALCGAAYFIWHLYFKFTTSPIIISRAPESVPIEQIPFPSLTVCNMNNARKSFAEKIVQGKDELQKFWLKDICNMELNSRQMKKGAGEATLIDNFVLKASQSCTEMLYHCRWNNIEMNCSDLFSPVYTDEGLCYNFNSVKRIHRKGRSRDGLNNTWPSKQHIDWNPEYIFKKTDPASAIPRRARRSGASHGLTLALDVNVNEYYCSSTASVGFKMLLHSPVETPQMREYGFTLSPGKETRVIITPYITDADQSIQKIPPTIRQCYFLNEKRLRYYRTYTERNCQIECEANFTLKLCNCMQYYMPVADDTLICDQTDDVCVRRVKRILYDNEDHEDNHKDTFLGPKCQCYPGCYEIEFSTEISQSKLVTTFEVVQKYSKNNLAYFEKNSAIVHVFYVDIAYMKHTKNELYGFVDLLSNTGGLLGLFMGFSLLSVTEIVYYVLLRIWTIVNKRRKEKRIIQIKRDVVYPFAQ